VTKPDAHWPKAQSVSEKSMPSQRASIGAQSMAEMRQYD